MLKLITEGNNRDVILFWKYAIKLPSLRNGSFYFVFGMMHNLKEWRTFTSHKDPRLAYLYWCSPFGLIQIGKRYNNIIRRPLTQEEYKQLPIDNPDYKIGNYALQNGEIIVLDYGHCDAWYRPKKYRR